MKITGEVAQHLAALGQVLSTILQQLKVHKNMCSFWGFSKISIQIIEHRDRVSDQLDAIILRQLSTEQNVDLQNLNKLNIGQTLEEIFTSDKQMAEYCRDTASKLSAIAAHSIPIKKLAEDIAVEQDKFACELEQQLELIHQMGSQNYIAFRC